MWKKGQVYSWKHWVLRGDRKIADLLILSLSKPHCPEALLSDGKVLTNPGKRVLRGERYWRRALLSSMYSMCIFITYPVRCKNWILAEWIVNKCTCPHIQDLGDMLLLSRHSCSLYSSRVEALLLRLQTFYTIGGLGKIHKLRIQNGKWHITSNFCLRKKLVLWSRS